MERTDEPPVWAKYPDTIPVTVRGEFGEVTVECDVVSWEDGIASLNTRPLLAAVFEARTRSLLPPHAAAS